MRNYYFKLGFSFIVTLVLFFGFSEECKSQYDTVWTRMTQATIKQVAFHPNSQLIATGNNSAYVSIWDVISGEELRKFSGASSNLALKFTEDGKYLAFGGGAEQGGVKIIDCVNWQDFRMIVTPTNSLAFINDENLIAIGGRKSITIWDFQTGELIKQIDDIVSPDHQGTYFELYQLVYSPLINSIIYTSNDEKLRFIDLSTYKINFELNNIKGTFAISNDGKYIAYDTKIENVIVQVMEVDTKKMIFSIPGSVSWISSFAFSPDNRYLAIASVNEKVLKIWDIQTGENVYNYIENPARYFNAIDWSEDNKFIAGGTPSQLFLYQNKLNSINSNESKDNEIIFPNPTDNTITLNFNLVHSENVIIGLLNINGQNVKALFNGFLESGQQEIKASIAEVPQGSYLVNVYSKSYSKTFKLIIEK